MSLNTLGHNTPWSKLTKQRARDACACTKSHPVLCLIFPFAAQPRQAAEHPEKVWGAARGLRNPPYQSRAALNLLLWQDCGARSAAADAAVPSPPGKLLW